MNIEVITDISDSRTFPHIGCPGERKAVLLKPWTVSVEIEDEGYVIVLPPHMHEYDGFTGQQWVSFLYDDLRSIPAWLLHDHLYITEGKFGAFNLTRKQVDELFYKCLKKLGYGPKRSKLAYWGVRLLGRFYW